MQDDKATISMTVLSNVITGLFLFFFFKLNRYCFQSIVWKLARITNYSAKLSFSFS